MVWFGVLGARDAVVVHGGVSIMRAGWSHVSNSVDYYSILLREKPPYPTSSLSRPTSSLSKASSQTTRPFSVHLSIYLSCKNSSTTSKNMRVTPSNVLSERRKRATMSEAEKGEWEKLTDDEGVMKKILKEGRDDNEPSKALPGYSVHCHYVGTLERNGEQFDSSRMKGKAFTFNLGKGEVIKAWDIGMATMKKGETAILKCTSDYAYGNRDQGKIKAGDTLLFEVEMLSFEPKRKALYDMTPEEKVQTAQELKEEGTKLFKNGQFEDSAERYFEATAYLLPETPLSDSEEDDTMDVDLNTLEMKGLLITCYLNASQAHLSGKKWADALNMANNALEHDKKNVKGLFRKGCAERRMDRFAEAKEDLLAAYHIDPTNAAVKKELASLKHDIVSNRAKDKATYGGFLDKVDMYDDKIKEMWIGPLPRCFLDISIGGIPAGRIVVELFANRVPKTAENFRSLCVGDKGNATTGDKLYYKGSCIHRVIKGFMMQGGDFTNGDGTGGEAIYGPTFKDENLKQVHNRKGLLSMANSGPDTNGSQFFITFEAAVHLDRKHVIFGEVVEGYEIVKRISELKTGDQDRPEDDVIIADCGELITGDNNGCEEHKEQDQEDAGMVDNNGCEEHKEQDQEDAGMVGSDDSTDE